MIYCLTMKLNDRDLIDFFGISKKVATLLNEICLHIQFCFWVQANLRKLDCKLHAGFSEVVEENKKFLVDALTSTVIVGSERF